MEINDTMQNQEYKNKNQDLGQGPDIAKSRNPAPAVNIFDLTHLEKLPFSLQKDEKIIRELKPQLFGFIITRTIGGFLGLIILIALAVFIAIFLNVSLQGVLIGIVLIPVLILLISVGPLISYGKTWYWITNHRVIGKRGLLGYSIDSIPLENVNDVLLSRTLLDRLLGLSSLTIVPIGGNARDSGSQSYESIQNANFFSALTQKTARELQRVLFNLRDELRNSHLVQPISGGSAPTNSETAQHKSSFPRGNS